MKIIHVIGSCSAGGAEMFVKSLLMEMKKQGADIGLWVMTKMEQVIPNDKKNLEFEKHFISDLRKYGIDVRFIGKRPNKDWFTTNQTLCKLFKEQKPEIIHTHLSSVSFHVANALLFKKVRLFLTIHSTMIKNPIILGVYLSKVFSKLIAISEKVKELVIEKGVDPNKVPVIFNGIDLLRFNSTGRTTQKKVKSLISIGRLTKAKNHKNLIEAITILKENYQEKIQPIPKTLIIGDGELKVELKNLVKKKGLEDYVIFKGIRTDIPELLKQSDIYVMSSDWEGLSISLIEALASGIPIVATDAGSNNEIIDHGKNGLIVSISDPEALAEAISQMINNYQLRKQFSTAGPEKASIFSIEECASKHLSLYNNI